MDTVVYFVRHSEICPKANLKFITDEGSSQFDNEKVFLSVKGEKKAEVLSKNSELKNIDAVYSSDYVRALETAKYFANENNTIINVDERLGERKIGNTNGLDMKEFHILQNNDFDYKLPGGESLNQTKKRMTNAVKNILMFEAGNRVLVVSHSTALTCLLSAWCSQGKNYDGDIILSYNDQTVIDGHFTAPMVFKVVFDGMNVKSVEYLNIFEN